MSSVIVAGNTSGSVSLTAPDVAGSTVITLPATSGTMALSGGAVTGTTGTFSGNVTAPNLQGPVFNAYNASSQSFSAAAAKVSFPSESIDTANCYDTSNSRFTPNVAGYYQINTRVGWNPYTANYHFVLIYKNGSDYQRGGTGNPNGNYGAVTGSWIIYCNGTTDYIEIYSQSSTSYTTEASGSGLIWFSGALIR